MNQTPRGLNRTLLVVIGLLFAAVGLHGLLISALPRYAAGWRGLADSVGEAVEHGLRETAMAGQSTSWIWVVVVIALIGIVLLMVGWIAVQGKGRTGVFAEAYFPGAEDPAARTAAAPATPGSVELGAAVPEQAVKAALVGRTDLVSTHVSTWETGGDAGLQIKVQPRLGAAPLQISREIAETIGEIDAALGRRSLVVIHLAAGARTRMSRAERVR
ncbi:hypothetical protein GCM10022377_24390 [Zhihengliuella alba]|uniref:Alkaline shock response membrane anchor protein AmaP n=1 Tax=Zhihengliuella alba TaxID=547018 RepID=A0ABP7DTY9_9MICC